MTDIAGAVLVTAVEGLALTEPERAFIKRAQISGVTLFARNIPGDHGRVRELTRDLQACRPVDAPPLIVAIDQEGGRVRRLRAPFPDGGAALGLAGGRDDLDALNEIRAVARDMAGRLSCLGINVDFAPCTDVLSEPTNLAIGDRAFARAPGSAAKRAGAFLAGLHDAGVLGCLKHFPGQGDAKVDTHVGKAVVAVSLETLRSRELVPFVALLERASMVMVAHCVYPALGPEEASRSPRIMQGLLRRELGYDGVVVSDDMMMGAIPQDLPSWQEAIVQSVAAGADVMLVCRDLSRAEAAHAALTREAARSPAFAARLADAAARVIRLRRSRLSL